MLLTLRETTKQDLVKVHVGSPRLVNDLLQEIGLSKEDVRSGDKAVKDEAREKLTAHMRKITDELGASANAASTSAPTRSNRHPAASPISEAAKVER